MDREFSAHLLDGRSAVPQVGVLHLEGSELVFKPDQGPARTWSVLVVRSVQRVSTEVHVLLPGADGDAPDLRLSVSGPDFEGAIDDAQRRFGSRARVSVQRIGRRVSLAGWVLIALIVVPATFALYTVLAPRLHVLVPYDKEAALGEFVHDIVCAKWRPIDDPEFERIIGEMVAELRDPALPFDLRVGLVEMDEMNAFALPGGRIVISDTLITMVPSADALAGVLAHEISHVEQRHSLKHLIRSIGMLKFAGSAVGGGIDGLELAETIVEASSGLLILKHSRGHERAADALALAKLQAAGRSVLGLVEFLQVAREKYGELPEAIGWISTHPLTAERIEAIERAAGATGDRSTKRPWMTPEEWAAFQMRF